MNNHWENLRQQMVAEQLIGRGLTNQKILAAFRKVPRHLFVPEEYRLQAYADHPLPIGENQTISQPYIVALMTELLNIQPTSRILEIGTGSGYQTAILAELASEVYTIERIGKLSQTAQLILQDLGYSNIHFRVGDGALGWPEYAPYDRIIVSAASPKVPPQLLDQLSTKKGLLVLPVGERFQQTLTRIEKNGNQIKTSYHDYCVFVPLITDIYE